MEDYRNAASARNLNPGEYDLWRTSPSLSSSPEPSSRQRASAWSAVRTVYKPENPRLQRRIIVRQEIPKQRYAEEGYRMKDKFYWIAGLVLGAGVIVTDKFLHILPDWLSIVLFIAAWALIIIGIFKERAKKI